MSENLRELDRWRGLYSVQHDRADRAEAERDDLRARLAKVEALADSWEHWDGYARRNFGERTHGPEYARALRAALASVPEPSHSEPDLADIVFPRMPKSSRVVATFNPSDSEPAPDADREAGAS